MSVVTSAVLTPWWHARVAATEVPDVVGGTVPTLLLDWEHPRVVELAQRARALGGGDPFRLLRTAHGLIANGIRPVYSVTEARPVSRVLALGRGSCSQRLATLTAHAGSRPDGRRTLLVPQVPASALAGAGRGCLGLARVPNRRQVGVGLGALRRSV